MKIHQIIIASLISFFFNAALAGDYEDGASAFGRGDNTTALIKFQSAAQQGNRNARYLLGLMYSGGIGVETNYKEALRWYRLAAEQGHSSAQSNLGFIYYKGQGVAQDYKEALRWYRLAAKQGHSDAQNNLGAMYAEGKGVLQDNIKSHMWFNVAAANDGENSVKNRDIVATKMTAQQIEQAQRMARDCMSSNFAKCD